MVTTQQAAFEPVHPWTFIAVDPQTGQRSLIAEVHPEVDGNAASADLRAFERRLFERNIRVGLHVTPTWTVVVRDLLSAMDFLSNSYDRKPISTPDLMRAAGLRVDSQGMDFVRQTRTWLEAIASSWHSFLPAEAMGIMVPEVVGNLAQANLEEWNGVLGQDDAR